MPSIQMSWSSKRYYWHSKGCFLHGLHLKIDNGGRLKTLRQTWWHHFSFWQWLFCKISKKMVNGYFAGTDYYRKYKV